MNIQRKVELTLAHIAAISKADDEDSAVREAALRVLSNAIEDERVAMARRTGEAIKAALNG